MNFSLKPALACLLVIAIISTIGNTWAANKKTAGDIQSSKPVSLATPASHAHPKPYNGTVAAVNKAAQTITVQKKDEVKTFYVVSTTKIMKAGKPVSLEEAAIDDVVGISYSEIDGGTAEAHTIHLTTKPDKTETNRATKSERAQRKPN